MTTKGNKKPSHLDKLLEDKPAEFQANVLRFALDSGMQPEDPSVSLGAIHRLLSTTDRNSPGRMEATI